MYVPEIVQESDEVLFAVLTQCADAHHYADSVALIDERVLRLLTVEEWLMLYIDSAQYLADWTMLHAKAHKALLAWTAGVVDAA